MSEPRIPVAGPWITAKEIAYVTDAVTNAWYENANIYHARFEAAFAAYLGVKHAVALPSCTSAIHLSLAALRVGPGDEVVVPDLTWIASAAPVDYVGATTVFADVDPTTWCLDPTAFEAAITPRTKAVIPVDLYGNVADMDAIRAVAACHGIAVIEDAAEAVGAELHGRKAGALGDMGVFSFHGTKTLTTGEGGMWVGNDDAVHERVLFLRDHGRIPGEKLFWNGEVAYKYRMSSMQAALGLAQLERIDELIARKRETFAWYADALADLPGVTLNVEAPGTKSVYWMVTAMFAPNLGLPKEHVIAHLREHHIDARPFFYPLSSLPAYRDRPQALEAARRNRMAYVLAPWGVNLPSALNLTHAQVERVAAALRALVEGV